MVSLPEASLALPGLQIESVPLPEPDSKFDFTLYVQEQADAVRINLVYNADLFDRERMEEMLRQLEARAGAGGRRRRRRASASSRW